MAVGFDLANFIVMLSQLSISVLERFGFLDVDDFGACCAGDSLIHGRQLHGYAMNIIRWPPSRDYMWSSNVNHTQLDKIGCMRRIGSGGSQVVVPILNMGWLSTFKDWPRCCCVSYMAPKEYKYKQGGHYAL
nr:hypothetical protein CFP56_16120 [Quercus suber]